MISECRVAAGPSAGRVSRATGGHFPHGESIYHGIHAAVARGGGSVELSATGQFTRRPDVAIVVFGELPYAESRGDLAAPVSASRRLRPASDVMRACAREVFRSSPC